MKENGLREAITIGGKSLLEVCIMNENKNTWPLEEMMQILLDMEVDPNVQDFENSESLLHLCYMKKKWKSLEMLIHNGNIDINLENKKDGGTLYGSM